MRSGRRRIGTPLSLLLALALLLAGCVGAAAPVAPAAPDVTATATTASVAQVPAATAPATVAPASPSPLPATATTTPAAPTPTAGTAATGEGGTLPEAPPPPATEPARAPHPAGKKVVCLDPGHGGPEVGAAAAGLAEKDVNLAIALKAAALLRAAGIEPVLTRDSDRAVDPRYTGGGYSGGLTYDVQGRVDICNTAQADLFFSIHNNGSGDASLSGTEVWYNVQREFSDRNIALAKLLQEKLLANLRAIGYPSVNRGLKEDTAFRIWNGRPYNLYVLGPGTGARAHVPTMMPGVLGESLFLSNAADAAMLRQGRTLDAIAAGYRDAALAYFAAYPD
ncbi:MAG: N-acetylmuramoyl-L-alanine amidase family protein [Chloroflexota bacterium]